MPLKLLIGSQGMKLRKHKLDKYWFLNCSLTKSDCKKTIHFIIRGIYKAHILLLTIIVATLILLFSKNTYSQTNLGLSADLSVIYRNAQVVEATGVESTFAIYSTINLFFEQRFAKHFATNINIELIINQQYAYKARYKEFFDLKPIDFGYSVIGFDFTYFKVIIGNMYSPDNDFINEQIIPPLVESVPPFSLFPKEDMFYYNILSSKPRDVPIFYDSGPFNLMDTGIVLIGILKPFYLSFYILNGEEGLDSNSSKYFAFNFLLNINDIFLLELFIGIGNIGSVPFKSHSDKIKINIEFNINNFHIQTIFSGFLMGLTIPNENFFGQSLQDDFGTDGLPFEPYDIPNHHNYGQPLYGYGIGMQLDYVGNLFCFRLNLSVMDADYRYDDYEIYKIKWRVFGDIGLMFFDKSLQIRIGASYTYNPVFLLGNQLYHFWEVIYTGPVDYRLNYYLIFVSINYKIDIIKYIH